jgi:site-specific DNA-methyltransferase (adenine-specific)
MIAPYYSEGGIVIYHADCRSILPSLAAASVVITDQPYGTGWVRGGGDVGEFNAKHERPEWDVFALDWLTLIQRPRRVAVFTPVSRAEETSNTLPNRAICYYRKTNVRPGGIAREAIIVSPAPRVDMPWDFTTYNGDSPYHPCQKPLDLMRWLVLLTSDAGDVIVAPFMGSGTTLRAAKDLGRKAIGIEISEQYCEIAARRLSQEVLQLW